MLKSGKTPLFRARNIEKLFDVGEIYIKLEGMNPSGHKYDRMAEVIIKYAKDKGYASIIIDGSYHYINALRHFAMLESFDVRIPVYKNQRWKTKRYPQEDLIRIKREIQEVALSEIEAIAMKEEAYLAIEGHQNRHISKMALEGLMDEITTKLSYEVDTIFSQVTFGYTLTSIHSALLRYWVNGAMDHFPKIICGTSDTVKRIVEDSHMSDYFSEVNGKSEKALVDETMRAVKETNADLQVVDENLLRECVKFLKRHEHIDVGVFDSYAFAPFYIKAKAGELKKGKHVIILNNAKSIINVQSISDFDEFSKDKLIGYTKSWLAQYSDSRAETEEAIQNAIDKGFLLIASRNGQYEGICVVVCIGFEHFHPTYHLAYVGTDQTSKGRGVATELINRAIELSGGKISLHVDLDNKGAKKLYEKLGFKSYYTRMIYKS